MISMALSKSKWSVVDSPFVGLKSPGCMYTLLKMTLSTSIALRTVDVFPELSLTISLRAYTPSDSPEMSQV